MKTVSWSPFPVPESVTCPPIWQDSVSWVHLKLLHASTFLNYYSFDFQALKATMICSKREYVRPAVKCTTSWWRGHWCWYLRKTVCVENFLIVFQSWLAVYGLYSSPYECQDCWLKREWVACAPWFSGQARTIIPGGLNALPKWSVQLLSPTSVGQGASTEVPTNPKWSLL